MKVIKNYLQEGKKAAVYFSIDDIHPYVDGDPYDAGGSLEKGPLGNLIWLHQRHKKLKTTLFVTADHREIIPFPTRKILSKIPLLNKKIYLSPIRKKGSRSLGKFPKFVEFLNNFERLECGFHGLHHIHKAPNISMEFQNQSEEEFDSIIQEMKNIFESSGLHYVSGICPPGWNCPKNLIEPLLKNKIKFIASARDVFSDISSTAETNMSGLKGVSLIYPEKVFEDKLIHFPSNFNPTNPIDRALKIIEQGGILGVKAHIIKKIGDYVAFDGLDEQYRNYLDLLFKEIENKFGDSIWWTSMNEISQILSQEEKSGSS